MEGYRFTDAELSLIENSPVPFAVYRPDDGKVVTVALSKGFCDLWGYDDKAAAYYDMDNDMYKDTHPDDAARIEETAFAFMSDPDRNAEYDAVYRSKNRAGDGYNIIHAHGKRVYAQDGSHLSYVWYTDEGACADDGDISKPGMDSIRHDETNAGVSRYDFLTGLPGISHFFDLAVAEKSAAVKAGRHPAMMFMDLCRMKDFNHKHGFAEGDRLLQSFARALARYFGSENCSRFGEDHFVVIADDKDIEKTLNDLFEECRWINGGLSLPVHVGIYLHRMEDVGAGAACDRAKLACDSIGNVYSSGFCYYDESMKETEENRHHIVTNLDRAIEHGWIKVYFQPIVRAVSGKVCDEEALARWIDPIKGFLSPAEFIPVLEDCGLLYKLDLYILEQVLEKLKNQGRAGLTLVPQSVNLSRSDFDACDIVEEIRQRVDASGLSRSLITIEITESIIGSNFDFMKEQIARFRDLGFAVWMDDFGSGYSSLDALQSVTFDLIKFDMRFLQHFEDGDSGKVILTELIKMTNLLGVESVCEGVETEEQVKFLRETGCTKLQGYYYAKPMPLGQIIERYEKGIQIGFENPDEANYFETIGRVNLHDITVITQYGGSVLGSFFNSIPMAVIEINGDKARVSRSNQSCRDFIDKHFGLGKADTVFDRSKVPSLMDALHQCCKDESRTFGDFTMPDDATAHYFVRRIAHDPVTGAVAAVLVVLSVMDAQQGAGYANIARALAADYFRLYYVNLESENFIEYSSGIGKEELAIEHHGRDFFAASRKDALEHLYKDDRDGFVKIFTKENIIRSLDKQGTFTFTCRLLMDGEPKYVNMKIMRMQEKGKYIIIGVNNVDSQMRHKEALEKTERDRIVYSRIMALSGDYICMYTVDLQSGSYVEYSANGVYEDYGFEKSGENFFAKAQSDGLRTIMPEDYPIYSERFTKENVMREIERNGLFTLQYRLMLNGEPKAVTLRAALVSESDGEKLIVGLTSNDSDMIHKK